MSMYFEGLEAFSAFLFKTAVATPIQETEAVHLIADNYKRVVVGTMGDNTQLLSLAPATQDWRTRYGYTPDDPLVMTGSLRSSVVMNPGFLSAEVGSADPRFQWQEFGTSKIPPRPVFQISIANTAIQSSMIGAKVIGRMFGDPIASVPIP